MREDFEREMRKAFGDRLIDLSLRGSHARGEAREKSDIDYYVLLDEIRDDDLYTLERLSKLHSVQPFLMSKQEFERASGASRFQFFCENKELFDRLGVRPPVPEDGWEMVRGNFEDTLHACRHYLLEPHEPSIVVRRIFYYIKAIDFSLRTYMLLKTGMYPATRKALAGFVRDMPDATWVIDTLETWEEKRGEYEGDTSGFLVALDSHLRRLIVRVLP